MSLGPGSNRTEHIFPTDTDVYNTNTAAWINTDRKQCLYEQTQTENTQALS